MKLNYEASRDAVGKVLAAVRMMRETNKRHSVVGAHDPLMLRHTKLMNLGYSQPIQRE